MKERINQFLQSERLSPAEFADHIGVQRSSVSHVLNGRNNPSASFIQKMIAAFPGLNTRWLLLGEGDMARWDNRTKPDLFAEAGEVEPVSRISPKPPVQQKSERLEAAPEQANGPASVQSEEQATYMSKKAVKNTWDDGLGEIERIVVFYSDKTFKAYKPSK